MGAIEYKKIIGVQIRAWIFKGRDVGTMRIMISVNTGESLLNFHEDLIKEMVNNGHEVICTAHALEYGIEEKMTSLGVKFYRIPLCTEKYRFFKYFRNIRKIIFFYRGLKPDILITFLSKHFILRILAAIRSRLSNRNVFIMELDHAFNYSGVKNSIKKTLEKFLYRKIFKGCQNVFFVNRYDYKRMIQWGLVKKEQATLLNGPGVNHLYYMKKKMPETDVVCMIAPLLKSKGIFEFIEAAKIVHKKYEHVKFLLVGKYEEGPDIITEDDLEEVLESGIIYFCGFPDDVRTYLEVCSIFVRPSYYEGNARQIIEAEAIGRPIITTTAPGCRDSIIDGYNGFLVPPRNGKAWARKILLLLDFKELKLKMAENSYELCKENYDVEKINQVILEKLKLKSN